MDYLISETSGSRPHAIKTSMGPPITRLGNQLCSNRLKLKPAPWWVSTRLRTTLSNIVLCFAQLYDLSSHSIELLTACLVLSTNVCKCKSVQVQVGQVMCKFVHLPSVWPQYDWWWCGKSGGSPLLLRGFCIVSEENVIYILAPQMLLL